jgi:hypothetical protein
MRAPIFSVLSLQNGGNVRAIFRGKDTFFLLLHPNAEHILGIGV